MTREEFFKALQGGAKWDVGVSIARTNPLPLDANEIFESVDALDSYIKTNALAYPGQVVVVLGTDKVEVCVVTSVGEHGTYKELAVSSSQGGADIDSLIADLNSKITKIIDGTTIVGKATGDKNGNDIVVTYATKTELTTKETALKEEDTRLGGEITRVEGLIAPAVKVETDRAKGEEAKLDAAIKAEVKRSTDKDNAHDSEITAAKGRLDTLESKINGVTGAMHFKGVHETLPEVGAYNPGDVIVVKTKEYVLVEKGTEVKTKEWVELGDEGIHATKTEVKAISDKLDTEVGKLTAKDGELKGEIDAEVTRATGVEKTLTTNLQTEVDRAKGEEAKLLAKITPLETDNTTNKADIAKLKEKDTVLDGEISGLKTKDGELGKKITALEEASALHAVKTDVDTALALKEDKTVVAGINTRVTALEKIHETQDTTVQDLVTRLGTAENTIAGHTTSIQENKDGLAALTEKVTTAEDTIKTHGTDITALKAKDTELSGKIDANTKKLTTLEGKINTDVVKYTDVLILDGGDSTAAN